MSKIYIAISRNKRLNDFDDCRIDGAFSLEKAYETSIEMAKNIFCDTGEFFITLRSEDYLLAETSQTIIEVISIATN